MTVPNHTNARASSPIAPASRLTGLSRTLAACLASASLASAASAQASSNYNVAHVFSFTPAGDVVDVRSFQYEHAWLTVDGIVGEDHYPLVQDPGFEPFGTDSFLMSGLAENSGFGTPVPALYQVTNIPAAGTGGPVTHCTTVNIIPSLANACTSVDIFPFIVFPGTFQIDGKIGSSGNVTADVFGRGFAEAYAFSNTAIRVQGGNQMANGLIQWDPHFYFDAVGDGTSSTFVQDPITFEALDLTTGDTSTFDLLHIDAKIAGEGLFQWDPAGISINASEATVTAQIPSSLVAPGQGGKLEIIITGGIVSSSLGTGIFAATAPLLGEVVPLTVPVPIIKLNYDLGLNPNDQYQVRATLAGGGSAQTSYEPCNVDFNNDGIVDNGDIGLFITLFLNGDPAADITGDGVVDNGDIGAFVECFLASVG
ncbi:MAG: hypothetical protein ACI89L_001782 [Phycisphaerales bacterium]|jgi:hypothetical protein